MHLSAAMQGLLDKEWRHSRGYMLVTLILIVYAPVIKTLFSLLQGDAALLQWGQELNYALHFSVHQRQPAHYTGLLQWLPFTGSVLLGIIMLGTEQQSSLKYLVSTPVSRRQIILSKFIPGAATILMAMLINGSFLTALDWLYPMPFDVLDIFNWALLAGAVCMGYYTLGLLVSTFTGGVMAAGVVVFLSGIMLPGMLTAMIENIAARYFAVSQAVSIRIYTIGSYLDLNGYITRSDRHIARIDHYSNPFLTSTARHADIAPDYLMESGLLLMGMLFFLILAIIIFERISLSAGGAIFASNRARKLGLAIGSAYIAYLLVFPRTETLLAFSVYIIVIAGLIYTGAVFLYRLRQRGRCLG